MYKAFIIVLLALPLILPVNSFAQNELVAGPMLGYNEHREQLIWLEVDSSVDIMEIRYWKTGIPNTVYSIRKINKKSLFNPVHINLQNLDMDQEYSYSIYLDGNEINTGLNQQFKTRLLWNWRMPAPDISFLFGSCVYINDSIYDRPGTPYGKDVKILKSMRGHTTNFIIWGGDNIYLREADWFTETGIYYRYQNFKSNPDIRAILARQPNYAIWDDHDYGPNNSNKSYTYKELTLQAFKDHWGNNSFGEWDNPGSYSKFNWSDAEFFLMDNRFHRSHEWMRDTVDGKLNRDKDYFGDKQMEWLKNSLLSSRATFKIIVNGNQMMNINSQSESFAKYHQEFYDLIGFIKEYRVRGVVFMSGDRHFTEILKYEPEGLYPLYDITSSPISASPYSQVLDGPEGSNPLRVENKVSTVQNFMKIEIKGDRRSREMVISNFDIDNNLLWDYTIKEDSLKIKN